MISIPNGRESKDFASFRGFSLDKMGSFYYIMKLAWYVHADVFMYSLDKPVVYN